MKYAWVDQNTEVFVLPEMCAVLDASISGYRAWKRGGTPGRKRLTMAWFRRRPAQGVMHHSDRGSHAFKDKLKEFGMTCSMSRKGNCWDNAPTESWFNSFKNERYHGHRYETHAEMKAATFEYIEVFYNRKRQHSTLGYQSNPASRKLGT